MKRKNYERPTMIVVKLQHHRMLMTSTYETTGGTSLTKMGDDEDL
jgi:hypothetical protein